MFNGFLSGIEWLGNRVDSNNTLLIIAISILVAILLYEIVMTLVFRIIRDDDTCICIHSRANGYRRGAVQLVAWLFAIFMLLNVIPINQPLGVVTIEALSIPIVFLLAVYLIEFIFMFINNCKCCKCSCSCSNTVVVAPSPVVKEVEPVVEEKKPAVKKEPAPKVVKPVEKKLEEKKPVTRAPRATATKRVATPKAEEPRVGLGEKIQQQQSTVIKTEKKDVFAERATKIMEQESQVTVDETAIKMGDLQRRMEALRKTVNNKNPETKAIAVPVTTLRPDASIGELRQEQESLMKQYETLQNKLSTMQSEETTKVGYYSGVDHFERTGKPEALSKMPSRNKFDEEEVKTALLGLKHAMSSLQGQIDQSDEENR